MAKYNFTNDKPISDVQYVDHEDVDFIDYEWAEDPFFTFVYDGMMFAILNLFSESDEIDVYKLSDDDLNIDEDVIEDGESNWRFDFLDSLAKKLIEVYEEHTTRNKEVIDYSIKIFKESLEVDGEDL